MLITCAVLLHILCISGRSMDKIKLDAQEKGDLGLVAEVRWMHILTLKVLVTTVYALGHYQTG